MPQKKFFFIPKFILKIFLHLSVNFYWSFVMEIKTLAVCFFFYKKMNKEEKITKVNKPYKNKKKNLICLEGFLEKKFKNKKLLSCFDKLIKNETIYNRQEKKLFYSLWSNFGKKNLELKKFKRVYRKKLGLNFVKKKNGVFLIFAPQILGQKKEGNVFNLTKEKGKWLNVFF